jgi:hypothetical protein
MGRRAVVPIGALTDAQVYSARPDSTNQAPWPCRNIQPRQAHRSPSSRRRPDCRSRYFPHHATTPPPYSLFATPYSLRQSPGTQNQKSRRLLPTPDSLLPIPFFFVPSHSHPLRQEPRQPRFPISQPRRRREDGIPILPTPSPHARPDESRAEPRRRRGEGRTNRKTSLRPRDSARDTPQSLLPIRYSLFAIRYSPTHHSPTHSLLPTPYSLLPPGTQIQKSRRLLTTPDSLLPITFFFVLRPFLFASPGTQATAIPNPQAARAATACSRQRKLADSIARSSSPSREAATEAQRLITGEQPLAVSITARVLETARTPGNRSRRA